MTDWHSPEYPPKESSTVVVALDTGKTAVGYFNADSGKFVRYSGLPWGNVELWSDLPKHPRTAK